ncbi:MAG: dicarboxylate/amino acid:cation symporter [bacterium]|nr:dicarboxylate/amino acid:cation symporter [bacterium]
MKWWFRQKLYVQIIIAIVVGGIIGSFSSQTADFIKPVGDIFLRMLKMLIIPLTLFTLTSAVISMKDIRTLRKLGGMMLVYCIITSAIASALGVFSGIIFKPGRDSSGILDIGESGAAADFSILDNVVSWIPVNPFESLASGNLMQVIIIAIITGTALLVMGKRSENLCSLVNDGADLMIRITEMIMRLAPYGILALTANLFVKLDSTFLIEVTRFFIAFYASVIFIFIFVYPPLIRTFSGLNPLTFYRNIAPALLVAFSTTSSAATLPVSMKVAEEDLGISKTVWGFTLPFGLTINMDGAAAVFGCIAVFAANLHGIEIGMIFIIKAIIICLILSVANAGIKGSGIVMSSVLLQSLNMPLALVPVLAAVWPVLDIGTTTANITGDLAGTVIIGRRLEN